MSDEVIARIITEPATSEPKTTIHFTVMNRAAMRRYALLISAQRRAGKFKNVAEEWYLNREAELEAGMRRLAGLPPDGFMQTDETLITHVARENVEKRLQDLAAYIVFRAVTRHPSRGKTLMD